HRRIHGGNLSVSNVLSVLDTARVMAKYIPRAPGVLADARTSQEVRDWFAYRAYWAREAGYYRASVAFHLYLRRLWGRRSQGFLNFLKLPAHWLVRRLAACPVRPTRRV